MTLLLLGEARAADGVPADVEDLEALGPAHGLGDVVAAEAQNPVVVHEQQPQLGALLDEESEIASARVLDIAPADVQVLDVLREE